MSMFDMFKTPPAAPAAPATDPNAAPAAPAQPVQPITNNINTPPAVETSASPNTAPNGVVPDTDAVNKSPLDQFSTLWETDANAKPEEEFKVETLDPTKLQEVMSKVDLAASITPENLQKIQAGGDEAVAALKASMNTVAQQSMMQSAVVANKMIEQSVTKALDYQAAKIPNMIKEYGLNNALTEQNPIFSNPAVKPVIEAVQSQLSTKFPNATQTQLTDMAQDFVKAMGESFNPNKPTETKLPTEEDFSSFLDDTQIFG